MEHSHSGKLSAVTTQHQSLENNPDTRGRELALNSVEFSSEGKFEKSSQCWSALFSDPEVKPVFIHDHYYTA